MFQQIRRLYILIALSLTDVAAVGIGGFLAFAGNVLTAEVASIWRASDEDI